jgi:hypothetical protein
VERQRSYIQKERSAQLDLYEISQSFKLSSKVVAASGRERSPACPVLRQAHLDVRLLRHHQRIINFHAEVSHGALDLRVTEQELDCAQVLRALVDQRRLRASH